MGKLPFLFIPKKELEEIGALKRHVSSIEKVEKVPVVLVLKELSYRQKQYLLRERIPFIVDGKQIYLPFMALYLQERCSAEKQMVNEILPSAEMLFLYFIYKGADKLLTSQAAKDLGLTPTSLSRASKQLVEVGFLQSKRMGLQKVLFSKETCETLFQKAKELLPNPIKRVVYIPKELVDHDLLESGYSALSKYLMLNPPKVKHFATNSLYKYKGRMSYRLEDSNNQVAIELWRYDPRKLSSGVAVDELSLALALRDDPDERVEKGMKEMLSKLWGNLRGQGDRQL